MNPVTSHNSDHWLNRDKRRAAGKALRDSVPRSQQAIWKPASNRPDIVSLLEESNKDRLPDLIPIRYGRMLQSPLAFLRGSAAIMAEDLAGLPATNIRLQICGDCHLQNFGWFASPERNLVFDITDFDESRVAPWEWDVKRLVASAVVAARALNASKAKQKEIAQKVAGAYREHLAEYAELAPLEMWYVCLDTSALQAEIEDVAYKRQLLQLIEEARQKTVDKMLPKMLERVENQLRFKDRLPLIYHPQDFDQYREKIGVVMQEYRKTLSDERRTLLDRYRAVDVAYKVVGVGSVGLRCSILLMLDSDEQSLVLQIKEARASVLEKFVGPSDRTHHGHRIVHGQRVLQAASDIFLGWGNDSSGRAYYVRQLRDMKMSVVVEQMSFSELNEYGRLCGWALARAHAKAGDAVAVCGYLGKGAQFDEAMGEFATAYATQVEQDFETLTQAAKSGRIVAQVDGASR
jgi:uncharacterized protein (DUF2252 family)